MFAPKMNQWLQLFMNIIYQSSDKQILNMACYILEIQERRIINWLNNVLSFMYHILAQYTRDSLSIGVQKDKILKE